MGLHLSSWPKGVPVLSTWDFGSCCQLGTESELENGMSLRSLYSDQLNNWIFSWVDELFFWKICESYLFPAKSISVQRCFHGKEEVRGPVWLFLYFTKDAQRRSAISHLPLFVKVCLREGLRGAVSLGGPGNLHKGSGLWLQLLERYSNGSDLLSEPKCPHLHTGEKNMLCTRLARGLMPSLCYNACYVVRP